MNIIEQAAKRIEELRRAGVDVPWAAAGFKEGEPEALMSAQKQEPQAAPVTSPAAPVVDKVVAPVAPQAPSEPVAPQVERRSRQVELDVQRLDAMGYLVPGRDRSQIEEEFRIVKRPLLKNADGESAAPVARANLIMVTSALPGEGKTYTAVNLAMSIAMELDHTVLLVDADVVRPAVLGRLGLPDAPGLLDVLSGSVSDLSEVLLKTNIPKLTLLPAGTPRLNSTELLASAAMEDLLNELATSYQDRIIIFDAPPLLPSTESRVLATRMGQVLVVVEADKTEIGTAKQAFAALESCPVVMSVLNKCRGKRANSAYGYYAV